MTTVNSLPVEHLVVRLVTCHLCQGGGQRTYMNYEYVLENWGTGKVRL